MFCVKFATILTQKTYTSKKYIIVNILSIKFYHVAENKKNKTTQDFVNRVFFDAVLVLLFWSGVGGLGSDSVLLTGAFATDWTNAWIGTQTKGSHAIKK